MKKNLAHLLKGAIMLGAAATLSDIAGNVQVLGLDASTAALVTAVLVAAQSWLTAEAEKE